MGGLDPLNHVGSGSTDGKRWYWPTIPKFSYSEGRLFQRLGFIRVMVSTVRLRVSRVRASGASE